MEIIYVIIGLAVTGIVFGALGRLAVPGPNPMSIGMTVLCGIGGSLLGTVVAAALGAREDHNSWLFFVLQVLGAALIVWFVSRRRA